MFRAVFSNGTWPNNRLHLTAADADFQTRLSRLPPQVSLVVRHLEANMKRVLSITCLIILMLCASQAETQERKEKPAVTLTLIRVRGVESFATLGEGPRAGQKVRNVVLACDVAIDNQTGEDLTVLSHYFSAFDGLSVVVLKDGKELRSRSYLGHQSPHKEIRPYVLRKGKKRWTCVSRLATFPPTGRGWR